MAELNLNQIIDKLNEEFAGDARSDLEAFRQKIVIDIALADDFGQIKIV